MTREKMTARAVVNALPSTHDPTKMPSDELKRIGMHLQPSGVIDLVSKDPQVKEMRKISWELIATGFLLGAIHSMPYWMYLIMEMKEEEITDKKLEAIWYIIERVRDPVRQAKQWIDLSCGYSEEEVIINQMEFETSIAVEAIIDDRKTERDVSEYALRCQRLEDE